MALMHRARMLQRHIVTTTTCAEAKGQLFIAARLKSIVCGQW